ncbi:MAG: hypothetical protein KatS3mg087_1274 [Patescibacteria group bacterium]|nr:MAG: hypothetical protein KatS3mg087_1274 [Patescibacteria group bacterium]
MKIPEEILDRLGEGYLNLPKKALLMVALGDLTREEFLVYLAYNCLTKWNQKYKGYGTVKFSDKSVATLLHWKEDSSVCRYRNNLLEKGLLKNLGEGIYAPKHFKDCSIINLQNCRKQLKICRTKLRSYRSIPQKCRKSSEKRAMTLLCLLRGIIMD